jgi:hypothetical protein
MSNWRAAETTLIKAAAEFGAWPERKDDLVFQKVLINIRDGAQVAQTVAQFGGKIPLMPFFVARAEIDAAELAARKMMHTTASVMADPRCQLVSAKAVLKTREELERARDYALSRTPYDESACVLSLMRPDRNKRLRDDYVSWINSYLAIHVPLDDPLVKRRLPTPTDLGNSAADADHARAVWARVREEARVIFGKAGDHVTDVFVTAAADGGILFTRDARRRRFKR